MNDVVLGALVGGAITVVASIVNHLFQGWKLRTELAAAEATRREERTHAGNKLRLDRFADFLAAYYATDGRLRDLQDLIVNAREGWHGHFQEIIESERHLSAVERLNLGRAWVAILAEDSSLRSLLDALSRKHEALLTELFAQSQRAQSGEGVDEARIEEHFQEVDSAFAVVLERLKEEVNA